MGTTLFSPTRYAWLRLRGALGRYHCGRRFGHFRAEDWAGNATCSRCNTPMI